MSLDEESPTTERPPPADGEEDHPGEERARRRKLETLLRETIRRGIEAGLGTISRTDDALRDLVGDNVKLPKEIVGYVFSQVDETKNALVRVVAREVRDFLEATDIAAELQKALTSLSFEIKTEIRFIPNDSGGVKPDVKANVVPRRGKKSEPPPTGSEPAPSDRAAPARGED